MDVVNNLNVDFRWNQKTLFDTKIVVPISAHISQRPFVARTAIIVKKKIIRYKTISKSQYRLANNKNIVTRVGRRISSHPELG